MDYSQITDRLEHIRTEIEELRYKVISSVQDKIQTLKMINILLREQNHLLSLRQCLIIKRQEILKSSINQSYLFQEENQVEKVA